MLFSKKNKPLKNYEDLLKRTNVLYKAIDELIQDIIQAEDSFVPDPNLPGYFKKLLNYYQVLINHIEEQFNLSKVQRQEQMAGFQKMLDIKINNETFNIQMMNTIDNKETIQLDKFMEENENDS